MSRPHEKVVSSSTRQMVDLGILCGVAIPIVFWGTLFICGRILGGYSHISRMVSELGELGTRSQYVFTAGLLACAVLSLVFTAALLRKCKQFGLSTFPVWVILTYTFSIAGAGIFPYPTHLHMTLGSPSAFLFLSPMLAIFLWHSNVAPSGSRLCAAISLMIMLLGFLAFFPGLLPGMIGLKQRFFHLGWSIWFVCLSLSFLALKYEPADQGSNPHA